MKAAYIRVSSLGQSLDVQHEAVTKAGAEKVFAEKRSGVDQDRPELRRCLEFLREGDELVVTKADRIARSAGHLMTIVEGLEAKGVKLTILDQPELSTSTKTGSLVVGILACVAKFERQIILERQADGIRMAKAKGIKFGRKALITDKIKAQCHELRDQGRTIAEIGREVGLKRSSVYNALKA